jgi:predicted metal-dependent HD superfamily phosphohydrolase
VNYDQILEEVERFVTLYFKTHHDERFTYHNRNHTRDVVASATQMADHYQLNSEDRFVVITAAWFHDTGYLGNDMHNHEEQSSAIAADFLNGLAIDKDVIGKIHGCIMATQMPQKPHTLLENIVCDADLFHLGTTDFREKSKRMRQEFEALKNIKIKKEEWRAKTIQLMEQHQYHTDYARLLLGVQKEKNLQELKDKQTNTAEVAPPQPTVPNLLPAPPGEDPKVTEKKNKEKPTKGVETMFRVTASNHQRLSDMADSKAHIMISVNSIVISLLLSLLLRRLDEHPRQTIPAIILLTVSLVTIVFSILATRPTLPQGTFTEDDVDNKRVNLLFFGNFYKMSLDQYNKGMVSMMNDRDFLYGSLIRDLYSQGVVLGRKYRLLRISYSVFMYGLVFAVLAFIVSAVI